MKKLNYDYKNGCPIKATVDVLGGRWKPTLLYHLFGGTKRFGEIRRLMPEVTQRILTLQLRELEEDGVVLRHVYAQVPPKVEYSITPFGRTLEPVILQMQAWGKTYIATKEHAQGQETADSCVV